MIQNGFYRMITKVRRKSFCLITFYFYSPTKHHSQKHHYRELPEPLRESLGTIPDQYVTYFTKRFPRVLMHTYHSMRTFCQSEPPFRSYYDNNKTAGGLVHKSRSTPLINVAVSLASDVIKEA